MLLNSDIERGFTLIEMLVVLAILATVITLVPPKFEKSVHNSQLKKAVYLLASELKATRIEAIQQQKSVNLVINVDDMWVQTAKKKINLSLPSGSSMLLKTVQSEYLTDSTAGIRFFADGSSSGGDVIFKLQNAMYTIHISWLTGKVGLITEATIAS